LKAHEPFDVSGIDSIRGGDRSGDLFNSFPLVVEGFRTPQKLLLCFAEFEFDFVVRDVALLVQPHDRLWLGRPVIWEKTALSRGNMDSLAAKT
jgi:hypothetical protein